MSTGLKKSALWITIFGLIGGLSAVPAAALPASAIGTAIAPPTGEGYLVTAPGCPSDSFDSTGSSGSWSSASSGSYSGPVDFGGSDADGTCSGATRYTLTATSQTAQFRWHFYDAVSFFYNSKSLCAFYVYIPSVNAGDQHARYDFWYDNGDGNLHWSAWPGKTFNQETMQGWYYIGTAVVPAGNKTVTVSLSNADASSPGWYAGVGAMAAACAFD